MHARLPLCTNAALFQSVPLIGLCGFSLLLGPVLPSCVRVSATETIVLDWGSRGVVRSETETYGLFRQHDDGLAFIGSCGGDTGALAGPRVPPLISQRP